MSPNATNVTSARRPARGRDTKVWSVLSPAMRYLYCVSGACTAKEGQRAGPMVGLEA